MPDAHHAPTAFEWTLLDKYFRGANAKYKLTQHHLQSYSDFIRYKIPTILQDFNSYVNSEVYNGARLRNDPNRGEENANAGARLHFFVGMDVHDVWTTVRKNARVDKPKRMQVRHQVVEHTHEPNKPMRFITPNEARLRNLNYQLELTVTVAAFHHAKLPDARQDTSPQAFVRACTDEWHTRFVHVQRLLTSDEKRASNKRAVHDERAVLDELYTYFAKENPKQHSTTTRAQFDTVVEAFIARGEALNDSGTYAAQRIAALVTPSVTLFDDVVLTKLPLMLHSPFCLLHNQPDAFLRDVGECPYEKGGYFVIRGKEKVIISQEEYQRNIIQTKVSERRPAPPSYVSPSTLILYSGDSKPTPADQEEVFEAVINCSDDPRPPCKVQLEFKQLHPYGGGGGGGDDEDVVTAEAMRRTQLNEMHKHLPFRGLYVTLNNRKGETILNAFPLCTLFRAMGVTNSPASTYEVLSDRDIVECILGYDTSGTVKVNVSAEEQHTRVEPTTEATLSAGGSCWYLPQGDGGCAWLTLPHAVTWTVGQTLHVQTAHKAGKASNKTFVVSVVVTNQPSKHHRVRLVGVSNLSAWQALTQWNGGVQHVKVSSARGIQTPVSAVLTPHRYARRHRATVLAVDAKHVTLAYHTHTRSNEAHDPILVDLLRPSVMEGSFAVTQAIAWEMLDQQMHKPALKAQDEQLGASRKSDTAKDYREALFRTLFTHLNDADDVAKTTNARHLLRKKQFYLGYMTRRLLFAYLGLDERETSRDSYRLRRVQLSGEMLADVFRYEYFQLGNKYKEYVHNNMRAQGSTALFDSVLDPHTVRTNLFDAGYMTDRLQKSFMGNWGSKVAETEDDQKAYCQELIRLSYFGSIAYLRRVHKELPATGSKGKKGTSKAVGPRLLHASQYGMICPLETPDGGNIGKIKHLSTFAFVCPEIPPDDLQHLLAVVRRYTKPLHELDSFYKLRDVHKVIVDGNWAFYVPSNPPDSHATFDQPQVLAPDVLVSTLRLLRRNGIITPLVSIAWNIQRQEIVLSTQEGRVMRPLLTVEHGVLLFSKRYHNAADWTWGELLSGRALSGAPANADQPMYHALSVRWTLDDKARAKQPFADTLRDLQTASGVMEYIDTTEIETRMLCMHPTDVVDRDAFYEAYLDDGRSKRNSKGNSKRATDIVYVDPQQHNAATARLIVDTPRAQRVRRALQTHLSRAPRASRSSQRQKNPTVQHYRYTHCELHPALMLGVMGMLIPFPEHSQAPRNQYSCHQSKQALGIYVSNFRKRMDHANHIMHYPQRPLTGSRFVRYINKERLNYGTNVIVAIMCYGGYNIEDAVLFNKTSVARGLFQSTYYFTEEVTEKNSKNEKVFIGRNPEVSRSTHTNDYRKVDAHPQKLGVLPASFVDEDVSKDDVLIEAYEEKREGDGQSYTDYKRVASKDAHVDQIFLSDNERGRRVAKVTLRTIRVPTIGDKFASRSGQKGTLGALVDEADMPFVVVDDTNAANAAFLNGIKPDVILNPHAIPSRMTVGQLLESLSGVVGARLGKLADSTPLCSNRVRGASSDPSARLTEVMEALQLHPHGNQQMCNGITGEMVRGEVFIGPTYYQRLKQMPVDKYYHRRQGRADMVTRQPIGGRAQGGALKLGEMERDSLLSHGISVFTKEAFNEKSDGFQYRVDNTTGDVEPPMTVDKVDTHQYAPVRDGVDFLNDDDDGGFRKYLRTDTDDPSAYHSHADVVDREPRKTNAVTSKVNVPFATRLLSQECETMGVGMHLLTERSYGRRVRRLG